VLLAISIQDQIGCPSTIYSHPAATGSA